MEFLILTLVLVVAGIFCYWKSIMEVKCLDCGFQGQPFKKTLGTFVQECVVWIVIGVVALATQMYLLFLIPFGFTLLRATMTKKLCAECHSEKVKDEAPQVQPPKSR